MKKLFGYGAIGWDFDGTLLGHPLSARMLAFIRAHPKIKHELITFRTDGLVQGAINHLHNQRALQCFSNINAIPSHIFEGYWASIAAGPTRLELLFEVREKAYKEWKALTCKDRGLAVMVDDDREHVGAGCLKLGIPYLHPDELAE